MDESENAMFFITGMLIGCGVGSILTTTCLVGWKACCPNRNVKKGVLRPLYLMPEATAPMLPTIPEDEVVV